MKFFKPANLNDFFEITAKIKKNIYFLAGGTDINVQIKNNLLSEANIIFINNLSELKGIYQENDQIVFGALTTFRELINSSLVKKHLPLLSDNLQNFASPLIQTSATIGGNIANGSPTADIMPLLMILDANLIIAGKAGSHQININDFYHGYKQNKLNKGEVIKEIRINRDALTDVSTFYKKVGARKTLTIAKVTLAGLMKITHGKIEQINLAVGSLNEYARRLPQLEAYLTGKTKQQINLEKLKTILAKEITPISDLRSEKEYRFSVCLNLIRTFVE
ncbi:MAG: FAD binding domain-containing protein [Candidatus Cloacimonetes bacterium]|nr:FAD binding domain-containing protein [Candidatus Cloacimonadota bacterium]